MLPRLNGKKVLVLVSNGVDEAAMSTVQRDLLKAGAAVKVVGTEPGLVNSWNGTAWGLYFTVDIQISLALGADFDFLVAPSGSRSIQKLAVNPHSERIIGGFVAAHKPMCFMGDAVELLGKFGHSPSLPFVMSGDAAAEGVPAFVQRMIVHFAGDAPAQIAA